MEIYSMKLYFVIPAYDEEQSIESIIKRSLAARQTIITNFPVDEVEITVKSAPKSLDVPGRLRF
jgi:hypothetical protein